MNKKRSMGINAVLNVIRQTLSIIFPLITYPYALRVLGADAIGRVNYGNSIVKYFSLIAMLGVSTYAVREGSKIRTDRKDFNQFINEIFSINIGTTIVSYLLLIATITIIPNFGDYRLLILLESLSIILTTLGVDYINTIYEDFLLITIRSIVTHVVSMILLFVLVHTPEDYYRYALLSVITSGIICVSNLFYCRKYVHISIAFNFGLKRHLKPLLILFANTLAITVYVNIDTTMLGWMKGDNAVGLYSAAVNVYSILKSLLAAIYVVAVPRLSGFIGKSDMNSYNKTATDLFGYISLLLLPAGAGVICLSREIMQFMGGSEFAGSVLALQILGGSLIFAIFGGLVTSCINITLGREKENLKATLISALINFVLNLFFIQKYSLYGAAFTTLLSEAFVLFYCFAKLPDKDTYLKKKDIVKAIIHGTIGVAIVVLVTIFTNIIVENYILRILITIVLSLIGYALFLSLIKDKYWIFIKNVMINKITHRS